MRGVPQKRKKQMGLKKRMNRLLFSTMIPMDINILSNITYLFLILSFPEHYTKDIEDIVSIYKDVVKSYVKLNDKLELKSPIDINAGLTF